MLGNSLTKPVILNPTVILNLFQNLLSITSNQTHKSLINFLSSRKIPHLASPKRGGTLVLPLLGGVRGGIGERLFCLHSIFFNTSHPLRELPLSRGESSLSRIISFKREILIALLRCKRPTYPADKRGLGRFLNNKDNCVCIAYKRIVWIVQVKM